MSLVQIEQVRPYSGRFTCSIISASSVHFSTANTGPKISSRAIVMSGVTSAKIVGSTKKPPCNPASSGGVPPHTNRAPSAFAVSM